MVEWGPVGDVLSWPRHLYTAALAACQPSLDGVGLEVIPGRAETITTPLAGCPFADRCPHGDTECRAAVPALGSDAHTAACWHPRQRVA